MLQLDPLDEFFEARLRESIKAGADEVVGRKVPGERFYAQWLEDRERIKLAFERTATILLEEKFTGVETAYDNGSLFLRVQVCDGQCELKLTPSKETKEVEFTITGMEGGSDRDPSLQPISCPLAGLIDELIETKLLAFAHFLSKLRAENLGKSERSVLSRQ